MKKLPIFDGSPSWIESTEGYNIIHEFNKKQGWSGTVAAKFLFECKEDTVVKINGSTPILLTPKDDVNLTDISSFELVNSGDTYRFLAEY